jgi:TP901 family phage tail tape measure protein
VANDIKFRIGAIEKISKVLKKVESSFPKVSRAVSRTTIYFKAFQQQTKGVRNALTKIGSSTKALGQSMLMTTTLPIVGAFGFAIKKSMDFQASMNKVKALTNATGEQMADMSKLARKLGSETKFSASEAADAMGFLGMAGWKTQDILSGVPGLLDLAAASNIELGRAADIASNIMGAFGIEASKAGRVADVLAATTSSANVDMEMLADTMKFAGPVAKQYGLSLEETAAAAGVLGNVGIQGTLAGTGLKNMMLGLTTGGSKVQAVMSKLGVAVSGNDGKLRSITDIMGDLGKKIKGLPKTEQLKVFKTVFGKIGISSAAAFSDSIGTMTELTDKLVNNVDGTAGRMAKTMNSGAKGAMTSLKSAIEGLAIAFTSSGILDIFTKTVEGITSIVRWMSTLSPTTMKIIGVVGVLAAALGPILTIFGVILTMLPGMITGWGLLTAGVAGFGVAFNIATLGIPAAIVAIIAGIGALIYYWDEVWAVMKNIASWIGDVFMGLFDWLDQKLAKVTGVLSSLSSVSSFFGNDNDSGANGQSVGAASVHQTLTERKESKSSLALDFSSIPTGTKVESEGDMNGIDLSMGFVGGMA